MHLTTPRALVCLMAIGGGLGCAANPPPARPPPADRNQPPPESATWDGFWRSRGVSPAPPPDFLEPAQPLPQILNLTGDAISDEVVRRWVSANLRRGTGDQWAACHLRADVVDADVLGPPGLNGTKQSILDERAPAV
jgi:hypothetical protein